LTAVGCHPQNMVHGDYHAQILGQVSGYLEADHLPLGKPLRTAESFDARWQDSILHTGAIVMDSSSHESAGETPEPTGEELSPAANTRIGSGELHPGAAKVRAEILHQLRAPFQRMLADYLGCAPTVAAIQKFADKSPDRWVQGLVMLGQMAGYTKDVHVTADIGVSVRGMSDVEVRERLAAARETLATLGQGSQLPLPSQCVASGSGSGMGRALSAGPLPTTLPQASASVPRETLHADSHSPRTFSAETSDILDVEAVRINEHADTQSGHGVQSASQPASPSKPPSEG